MRSGEPYLLPEFATDLATGHNVVSTVYAECRSMYRQTGPDEPGSLGETELPQALPRLPVVHLEPHACAKRCLGVST